MLLVSSRRSCLLSASASTSNLRANSVHIPSVYLLIVESAILRSISFLFVSNFALILARPFLRMSSGLGAMTTSSSLSFKRIPVYSSLSVWNCKATCHLTWYWTNQFQTKHLKHSFSVKPPLSWDVFTALSPQLIPKMEVIPMGFFTKNLWVNVLDRVMGFRSKFPAHQIGGPKNLWDMGGYGFIRLWDRTGLTVLLFFRDLFQLRKLRTGRLSHTVTRSR